MMLSPEQFYDMSLKGKNAEEIKRVIRGLKREITRLKRVMEHPDYKPMRCPFEGVQLECVREYLEIAIYALEERGEAYIPTLGERRAMSFADNLPFISRIKFHIGSFFGFSVDVSVEVGENVNILVVDRESLAAIPTEKNIICEKNEFLDELAEIRIGEWRKRYSPERNNICIMDGTEWDLTIEYSNGRKSLQFGGDNAYPYDFRSMLYLLGVDVNVLNKD